MVKAEENSFFNKSVGVEYYEGVKFGTNLYYRYDQDTKILTLSGDGTIYSDFDPDNNYYFEEEILNNATSIVFEGYNANTAPVFQGFKELKNIEYPFFCKKGISIYKCHKLESVTIPDGYGSYPGSGIISTCDSLRTITFLGKLGNSDEMLSFLNLYKLPNLESLSIPSRNPGKSEYYSYYSIGLITNCANLKTVSFPNNATNINGFDNCSSLEEIIIPDGVEGIGGFNNCTNLTKITIPASVKSIHDSSFQHADKLTIYGYTNTVAEKFARKNLIPFVSLGTYTPPKDDGGNQGNNGNNNSGGNSGGNQGGTSGSTTPPAASAPSTSTSISVTVNTNTNDKNLAQKIQNADSKATINATVTGTGAVSSDVFEAIRGTDKTLTFTNGNIQWTFEGNDIIRDSKDLNVSAKVELSNKEGVANKDAINEAVNNTNSLVVTFPDNGTLPGKARIRVTLDSTMKNHIGSEGIHVYYFNNRTGQLELVARNITVSNGKYVEFSIVHCSSYVVTSKKIVLSAI